MRLQRPRWRGRAAPLAPDAPRGWPMAGSLRGGPGYPLPATARGAMGRHFGRREDSQIFQSSSPFSTPFSGGRFGGFRAGCVDADRGHCYLVDNYRS